MQLFCHKKGDKGARKPLQDKGLRGVSLKKNLCYKYN